MIRDIGLRRSSELARLLAVGITLFVLGCGGDALVGLSAGERNRRVSTHVGDPIEIVLQTIGPGEYASPPAISSPAVVFQAVTQCGSPVPAGPTQCFHF